jgi:hypothetical protein
MKRIIYLSCFLSLAMQSCERIPIGCMTASKPTFKKGETIIFDASCSQNANSFSWSIDKVPIPNATNSYFSFTFLDTQKHILGVTCVNKKWRCITKKMAVQALP